MGNSESASSRRRGSGTASAAAAAADEEHFEPPPESASYWSQFRESYDEIIDSIVRPERVEYTATQLGPSAFEYRGKGFARADFTFQNRRRLALHCSHWHVAAGGDAPGGAPAAAAPPDAAPPGAPPPSLRTDAPCIIYLHSHVACRLDAIPLLRTLLGAGVDVLALDLGGHGQSEGEHVSLGWFERDDVEDLIAHMRRCGHSGTTGLWGHYTGAVAALLHADRDPSVACLVLEGAVADIKQLVTEWVAKGRESGYAVPQMVVGAALRMIRRTVRQRAGFDAFELRPIEKAATSFIPALFVVAKADPVVLPHHGKELHAKYAGDKNLIECPGDNLTGRSQFLLDSASIFVANALRVPPERVPDAAVGGELGGLRTQLSAPWGGGGRYGAGGGGAAEGLSAEAEAAAAEEEMLQRALALSLGEGLAAAPPGAAAAARTGSGGQVAPAGATPPTDAAALGGPGRAGAAEEDDELQRAIAASLLEAQAADKPAAGSA